MKDIHKIEKLVESILREDEKARNSDDYLYFTVCQRRNMAALYQNFGEVLLNFNRLELPKYASVSRARRKLQAKFPELKPTENVKDFRLEREIKFETYAKERF